MADSSGATQPSVYQCLLKPQQPILKKEPKEPSMSADKDMYNKFNYQMRTVPAEVKDAWRQISSNKASQ